MGDIARISLCTDEREAAKMVEVLIESAGTSQVVVVCDRNVASKLPSLGLEFPTYLLDAFEEKKTLETVMDICRWLLECKVDRSALVLGVGGGVTSDISGFAASIYKRGIRYANIPTTLLAQVDAAIGGKTGVNLDGLKNMLGVIRQPEFILLCPHLLSTLARREFISGSAEMLKNFLLSDYKDYTTAVETLADINSKDILDDESLKKLTPMIHRAASFKSDIVTQDPTEKGLRRILNFGHTYGHAIEWWQQATSQSCLLTHGEAVAIGIVHILRKSGKKELAEGIAADFIRCGLPTELPCREEELLPAIEQDKKQSDGHLHCILLQSIGNPVIE